MSKKSGSLWQKILVIPYIVVKIENGEFLRPIFAWFFRVLGAAIVLGILLFSWQAFSQLNSKMSIGVFFSTFGSLLIAYFFVFIIVGILFIRAQEIMTASLSKAYPMLSLFSVVVKVFFEFVSVLLFLCSILALLIGLFFAKLLGGVLGAFGAIYGFYAGYMLAASFLILVTGYSVKEFLSLLIRIEINTRKRKSPAV